ncbi:MAG: cytochrome c [Verrucomicrobia bacterium]|nr:cytochrome c [Verrucomicrobiota bacterium]
MNSRNKSILLGIALLGAALAAAQAEDVKALYEKECAKCHGSDGRGDTKMGKKLGAKDYTDPAVLAKMKDDAAFKAIKEGLKDKADKTLMKPFTDLTDDQIKALIAYMRAFPKK